MSSLKNNKNVKVSFAHKNAKLVPEQQLKQIAGGYGVGGIGWPSGPYSTPEQISLESKK